MATDRFNDRTDSVFAPATAARAVTPSDVQALTAIPKALYVGSGGDLVLRGKADNADQTWRNVPSGALIPFRASHVRATGTTATDLLALY